MAARLPYCGRLRLAPARALLFSSTERWLTGVLWFQVSDVSFGVVELLMALHRHTQHLKMIPHDTLTREGYLEVPTTGPPL